MPTTARQSETTRVVALAFHEVIGNGHPGAEADAPSHADTEHAAGSRIDARELEAVLSGLRQLGYQTVSSRAFRAWQDGTKALPERSVVLTFDYGHASHFDIATSLLLRYRFSGTFFVTVGRIGRPGYMSWEQLRKLVFLGMEIGSCGMSQEPLTGLTPEALTQQLVESKRILEEQLGIPMRALAATGGHWNPAVAEAARRAGYDAVWVSTVGTNGHQTHPQALRRIVVRWPLSAERIVTLVEGWQPSFWWVANQQAAIRMLKRVLGVYWYEQLKRRVVPDA